MYWLRDLFKSFFCNEEKLLQEIKVLKKTNHELAEDITFLHGEIGDLDKENQRLVRQLNRKKSELEKLKQQVKKMQEIDKEYQEVIKIAKAKERKYPKAKIVYKGYPIRLKNKTIKPEIDVRDFVQVITSHKNWVEERGLTLEKYKKKYGLKEGINKLMFDIYRRYIPMKKYMFDKDLFGFDEYWATALENWYIRPRAADCENSALELMSLFKAAGIGDKIEGLYWNVCGMTKYGGHSTVYAWDLRDNCWRHLETTITKTSAKSFHELPNKNKKDALWIESVWFSFNSQVARSKFTTDSRKEYSKRKWFKNIIVRNR